jgi:hypothetical protein
MATGNKTKEPQPPHFKGIQVRKVQNSSGKKWE